MNSPLFFDFTVDRDNNRIIITREFDAELNLVWEAFTVPEILDQWGAPAPWHVKTMEMNFTVGGRRLYKMFNDEGQEHFSLQFYKVIQPKTHMVYISNFADKDGNPNPQFNGSENNLTFHEVNERTTVTITIHYESAAVLEMMVERGFKEGMSATLDNLDKLLTGKVVG